LPREDKFARIAALKPARKRAPQEAPIHAGEAPAESDRLAELLGAVIGRNRYGEHLVVRRWFSSPEPCAPAPHALRLLLPARPGHPAAAHERLADPAEWLFLDTETSGLAGGTGTYAFLVGLAWWEAGGLQVEQIFMRDYGEEHSLLLELSRRLAERRLLVTFNGKSFDWPLLETRYRMTRALAPRPPAAHLDLLHPARQLWRMRLGSVRLTELERQVLGPVRLGWDRRDDVDAAFIPQIYFDYLRGAPPGQMLSVFRHNQMDLRGLAALAGRVFALLSAPEQAGDSEFDALELYGLSRLLRHRGEPARARVVYERALEAGLPAAAGRAARRDLALLAKRDRDYQRANGLWEELLHLPSRAVRAPGPGPLASSIGALPSVALQSKDRWAARNSGNGFESSLEAYEQLAIYYEHQARQHARAAELTREALARLRSGLHGGRIEPGRGRRWQQRFERRLARLTRRSKGQDGRLLLESSFPEARGRALESK